MGRLSYWGALSFITWKRIHFSNFSTWFWFWSPLITRNMKFVAFLPCFFQFWAFLEFSLIIYNLLRNGVTSSVWVTNISYKHWVLENVYNNNFSSKHCLWAVNEIIYSLYQNLLKINFVPLQILDCQIVFINRRISITLELNVYKHLRYDYFNNFPNTKSKTHTNSFKSDCKYSYPFCFSEFL